jgi:ribosomal protein S18 acetylase RimI-like enzyme
MAAVRKATRDDVPQLSDVLARAFHDDPMMDWLAPGVQRKRRLFSADLRHIHFDNDELYTTPDIEGGAVWAPPGKWRNTVRQMVRMAPTSTAVLGWRIVRGLRAFRTIEKHHPREPHWYLAVLGTHPDHQGKGVGSALLAPVLARCDAEGVPAYLESSKEANVPFYRRHGFEVTAPLDVPAGGPRIWLMWREPRTA